MADEAQITPAELKFRFQLNKQLPAAINLYNPTAQRLAFKVKTTTPKKYVVRPSSGVVDSKSTAAVQVIMQAQKEQPADLNGCKDKFLVQVKVLADGEDLTQDTFKASAGVKDTKIRVVLEGPPLPPSPVPEVNEHDESDSLRAGFTATDGLGAAAGDTTSLGQENRALRAQLERLAAERDSLRSKLDKAPRAAGGASRGSVLGSLLPLLIVAVLAFVVGHYLASGVAGLPPALQQLLAKGVAGGAAPAAAEPAAE